MTICQRGIQLLKITILRAIGKHVPEIFQTEAGIENWECIFEKK